MPAESSLLSSIQAVRETRFERRLRTLYWVDTRDMVADGLATGSVDRTELIRLYLENTWQPVRGQASFSVFGNICAPASYLGNWPEEPRSPELDIGSLARGWRTSTGGKHYTSEIYSRCMCVWWESLHAALVVSLCEGCACVAQTGAGQINVITKPGRMRSKPVSAESPRRGFTKIGPSLGGATPYGFGSANPMVKRSSSHGFVWICTQTHDRPDGPMEFE